MKMITPAKDTCHSTAELWKNMLAKAATISPKSKANRIGPELARPFFVVNPAMRRPAKIYAVAPNAKPMVQRSYTTSIAEEVTPINATNKKIQAPSLGPIYLWSLRLTTPDLTER